MISEQKRITSLERMQKRKRKTSSTDFTKKKKKKKNPNEQNYTQPDWAETEGLLMSLLHRIKFMHLSRRDRQGGKANEINVRALIFESVERMRSPSN